ncbi:MAG: sodium:proton antiporter [Pseudomonadota bacterium]
MSSILLKIALIGGAGIGSQWLAWRIRIPAIALLLLAGLIMGPFTGYLEPKAMLGDLYKPIIGSAVAIILFEGGITLKFREIRETSTAVRRIIFPGGPLVWIFSALAAHYGAGLSWTTSIILGAILVVTGPTVIMPLLRQAQLSQRPASLLRWEAIVNDPIGAIFAVLAFETYLVIHGSHDSTSLAISVVSALVVGIGGGYAMGRLIGWAFVNAYVPEFLKSPVLLTSVLGAFAVSDLILEESGLLTVTVMGITLANTKMASLNELKRFKETVTILLVSGLFILLTASLDMATITSLGWEALIFVFLVLFIARPVAIFLATIGAGLTWQERLMTAWIAPRGIVAVAVSGLFGATLVDMGVADGARLTALTFAIVASTIALHGFTLSPLASLLGLKSADKPGVLIVGGSEWSNALAVQIKDLGLPVMVADSNWNHIRNTRSLEVPVYYGEVLSDAAHHDIAFNRYGHVIAASDDDAYNTLVCNELGPEFGRGNVFQLGRGEGDSARRSVSVTVGGKSLFEPQRDFAKLRVDMFNGWEFATAEHTQPPVKSPETGTDTGAETATTEDAPAEPAADQAHIIFWKKSDGTLVFAQTSKTAKPETGDMVVSFGPKQTAASQDQADTNHPVTDSAGLPSR